MHYSRQQEASADDYAIETLKKARISTKGFSNFFKAIGTEKEEGRLLKYLSTHPSSLLRQEKADASLEKNTKVSLNKKEWRALKNICQKKISYKEYQKAK